jgi:hypothetical protein
MVSRCAIVSRAIRSVELTPEEIAEIEAYEAGVEARSRGQDEKWNQKPEIPGPECGVVMIG